jgi:uncharacterized protein (TIGR02246 family)
MSSIEERIQRLEDERAVAAVLALYGSRADTGDHDGFVELFTDDAVIELLGGAPSGTAPEHAVWEGKERIREFINDPSMHMKIEGHCMHLPALGLRTAIEADAATAHSCSVVLLADEGSVSVYGAGFTRWELARVDGRWLIEKRSRVAIGAPNLEGSWT